MSSSDVSSATKYFSQANEGFSTTLGSTISAGATSVGLNSTVGLTNGAVFVGIIEPGATAQQTFTGTVDISGSQITNVVWVRGTNVGHAGGVTIVDYVSGAHHNLTTAGLLKQHTQAGGHTGITTDTITVTSGSTLPAGDIGTADIAAGAVTNAKLGTDISPANFANPYKFSVYQSADSGTITANTWTKAQLNTKDFDTGSNFDNVTNYRFTAPIAGFYLISGQIGLSAAGVTSGVGMEGAIYKNGVGIVFSTTMAGNGSSASANKPAMVRLLQLAANDYIELYGFIGENGRVYQGGTGITFLTGYLVSAT